MEREEQGRVNRNIGSGWSKQSKDNQIIVEWVDKIKMRRLYQIGLDQRKHMGLEQDDQTKKSRYDDSKKSGEDNSLLRKYPEG